MTSLREDVAAVIQARLLMLVPDECVGKVPQWAESLAGALPPQIYEDRGETFYAVRRVHGSQQPKLWVEEFSGTRKECMTYLDSVYEGLADRWKPKDIAKMVGMFRRNVTDWKRER